MGRATVRATVLSAWSAACGRSARGIGVVFHLDALQRTKQLRDHLGAMAEEEVVAATRRLLAAVGAGDYAAYESLSSEDLTCVEPETQGHIVEGLGFHKCAPPLSPLRALRPHHRSQSRASRTGTFLTSREASPVRPRARPRRRRTSSYHPTCTCAALTMPSSSTCE